jgi:radical SAM protein with 4Fe4S-binding SPASM domain
MDKFRIDSHKLVYHISRVHQWLKGQNIYPIYIEIGLFGGCNHRCIFCAFDFLKYKPDILDEDCLKKFIREAGKKGVKAVLYSGEGEPLLHNNATGIITFTKKAGIDVALVTNGVLFGKDKAEALLKHLTWLKVSLDAGSEKTYAIIHRTRKEDFNTVIRNLKEAVKIKNTNRYNCSIGVQFLLLPQNYRESLALAKILSPMGIDYLVIKPYCQHPLSNNSISPKFKYKNLLYLEEELKRYSRKDFHVIFRSNTMKKIEAAKPYGQCLGLPFATHITAKGDVYPCSNFVGKEDFVFGNICNKSFEDIWNGQRRRKIMDKIYKKWDVRSCRNACRLDEINRYLWELKNPVNHVNFI